MKKLILKTTCLLPILILWLLAFTHRIVENASINLVTADLNTIENGQVGLLLGTSKYVKNGAKNLYFFYRIDAAMALYHAGKLRHLVISGDNSRKDYNEPEDMRQELINRGFPSDKIHLDYAGFRTFDSVFRMEYIFGQKKFLIISQEFHNIRAVYIAKRLGLEATGFNAKDVQRYYGFKTHVRERLARFNLFIDFVLNKSPKFLGERIVIPD
jgi:SanA protein